MRRLLLVVLLAAVPPAAAVFFLTGCLTMILLRGDPDGHWVHSPVWEAFPKGTEQCEKYLAALSPCGSHGTGGDGTEETLTYRDVRRGERDMAAALETIQADLLRMVKDNGGTLPGEPHRTIENGCLKGFGFVYKQGGRTGTVRAAVKPAKEEGAWDLECVLQEEVPERLH